MKTVFHWVFAAALPVSIWSATVTGIVGAPSPGTPIGGAKVVLIDQTSAGAHLDSTTSAANGTYTFSNVALGQRVVQASRAGYNSGVTVVGISNGTTIYTANVDITPNYKTSVVDGFVKHGQDSSAAVGATVTLSGGSAGAAARTAITDSTGHYRFDSVSTGTGYNISAAQSGYQSSSLGNVATAWNAVNTVGTLYLTSNVGKLSGTIQRADSVTVGIPNAKVVVLSGRNKVDSTLTDVNGNYTLTLLVGSYNVSVSAVGYKSNTGAGSKDTTAAVTFGTMRILNVPLSYAHSTIGGIVRSGSSTSPVVAGAKVVLQHRMSSTGSGNVWVAFDSTTTDASGIYVFQNLIAAATAATGSYRVIATTSTATGSSPAVQVDVGATITVNIAVLTAAIQSVRSDIKNDLRFSRLGDQLVLNLSPSKISRTLEVFNMNGVLQQHVQILAGETRVNVPAAFAPEKGYLYGVK